MRCRVTYLTGAEGKLTAHRDEVLSEESLRIGRSTDSEVYLPDFRVNLHHATLLKTPDGLHLEACSGADVSLNGYVAQTARLAVGDRIGIGPYDLVLQEPSPEFDYAFTVEFCRPLGDDLRELKARSLTDLPAAGLRMRPWSWTAFLLVTLLFLAAPLWSFHHDSGSAKDLPSVLASTRSWKPSGDFLRGHTLFGENCKTCHTQSFGAVQNGTCLGCHRETAGHAAAEIFANARTSYWDFAGTAELLCSGCHREHQGFEGRRFHTQADSLCRDCHQKLDHRFPGTRVENVGNFSIRHPQFRYLRDQEGQKKSGEAQGTPPGNAKEVESLRQRLAQFPHERHLKHGENAPPVDQQCGSCHEPGDEGAAGLVKMAQKCEGCHGKKWGMAQGAPAFSHAVHLARGENASPEVQQCGSCHAREKGGPGFSPIRKEQACQGCHENPQSLPEAPPGRKLPRANFPHDKHATTDCLSCHKEPDEKSISHAMSIPGIENCRRCHGDSGEKDKLQTTCSDCHGYHLATKSAVGAGGKNQPH